MQITKCWLRNYSGYFTLHIKCNILRKFKLQKLKTSKQQHGKLTLYNYVKGTINMQSPDCGRYYFRADTMAVRHQKKKSYNYRT